MRLAVVVAVYNNVRTILEVLGELEGSGLPIFVIDDGSTDGTGEALDSWAESGHDSSRRVCHLAVNKGKAAAMCAGFDWARELGFSHVLTFDADGQHDASRIPAFVDALEAHGTDVLIVGSRSPLARNYPIRNRIGRFMSNLAIRAQCGVGHGDVPCGMRIYPLKRTATVKCVSGRYAWEEEFITRSVWAGCSVASVRIPSVYGAPGKRQSHYKFRRDWTEGIAIFIWLLLSACLPAFKWSALRRHAEVFLCTRKRPVRHPMSIRTEWLFFAASFLVLAVIGVLPIPFIWVTIAMMVWLTCAWHISGVALISMVGLTFVGQVSPELARVLFALVGATALCVMGAIILGWLADE